MERPTFQDVLAARKVIAPYLRPTPLVSYPALSKLVGAEVYIKREDTQPISSFKVRGGLNLMARLTAEKKPRGVVSASTGNHGQSVAYASRLFGVKCIIAVPEGANPLKVEAMRNLGADVHFHGSVYEDARGYAEGLAAEQGYRFVHPSNEPLLIAGVGTEFLECFEEVPDLDYIFAPLGGGSTASSACIVAKTVRPQARVIAVQSSGAPAAYRSWKAKRIVEAPVNTIAEGLATRTAYEFPLSILWELLDDFLLVSDEELKEAVRIYLEKCHVLSEPSGAAALAGAMKLKDELKGKKAAVILSGANITMAQLREVLGAN